ncbi:MAG TPA: ketoacyl-ACP synthase III [Thermoanaerobaculia bacterium]|nr:ketoacyl-ACP synthase III [Thermoanaerobaculia bacterium]
MSRSARIVSTGSYLPEIEVSNDALRARFDAGTPEFVDKMEAATGIKTRWYAPPDWATSDLAVRAARKALDAAGKTPADVDLILLGTDSPDFITPATSVVIQHKLGAKNAGTFDVGCACASFPTCLATAAGLIATNKSLKTVVAIGAYMMHKLTDPDDPMIFFFGDGAGAAVLEPSETPGFVASGFRADGSYNRNWAILSGGTDEPASLESVKAGRTTVKLVERYPPELNNEGWPKLVRQMAADGGFAVSEIDMLILTQVRRPTIELVMQDLGLPMEKTHVVMDKWGYTGSASVAMAFDDARAQGKVKTGDLVVFVASGVGYNMAGAAFRMV